MSTPTNDLVAFGATSFVGKILCRYLLEEFGAQGKMKWAAAGRSKAKLEELRSSLGPRLERCRLSSPTPLTRPRCASSAASTRVVVSTVGPYALYGEPLVKACADIRDRLLRPQRRGAVDPPHGATLRADGPKVRRAHCALLRVRLRPARTWACTSCSARQ